MKLTFTLSLLLLLSTVFAKQVDESTAKQIAQNYLQLYGKTTQPIELLLAQKLSGQTAAGATNYMYVFKAGAGFIIIAADDIATPVLAYSMENDFDANNVAPAVVKWLEKYKTQIRIGLEKQIEPSDDIKTLWNDLLHGRVTESGQRSIEAVNPLLTTTWNQSPYYNSNCPYDAAAGHNAITGCVATAMAQIMKFWNYPTTGSGFHSYNDQHYGAQSANFAATTYQWASMPNSITANNTAIGTLMYHCGVAVEMNYGPNESTAYVISADRAVCAQSAYTTYFGYNAATIQGLKRDNYSTNNWVSMMQNELNNNRPLQYAGFGGGGGHTWVCDGYDQNNNFHMNWGWGGLANGYYSLDALNPTSLGAGGGLGEYNSGEEAVIGIQPPAGNTGTASLQLYAAIMVNPSPIGFYQNFTVSTDIINNGTGTFNGDFCAALFNSSGTFIDFIGPILSTTNFQPNFHFTSGLTFNDSSTLSVHVSGNYVIGVYYRAAGTTDWTLAGNTNFTNPVNATMNGPVDNLGIYADITTTPTKFVQGQAATVTTNIWNRYGTAYNGQYEAVLLDLTGRNLIQSIQVINSGSLPANNFYNTALTFSNASITAAPGTYLLAIAYSSSGNWYYCGGDLHQNPILVDVVAPPLQPDIYETNNTAALAYTLPLNFTGNSASVSTPGSNCHIGTDYDYYKLNLPAGINYSVNARLQDSYSSNNGQTYTLDGIVSYSTNGTTWSDGFDDVIPTTVFNGGQTLYFFVSPYFPGQTGSYLLDVQLTKTTANSIAETGVSCINVYPNPAKDKVIITRADNAPGEVNVYDIAGRLVLNDELHNKDNELNISALAKGMYMVKITSGGSTVTTRLVVQ